MKSPQKSCNGGEVGSARAFSSQCFQRSKRRVANCLLKISTFHGNLIITATLLPSSGNIQHAHSSHGLYPIGRTWTNHGPSLTWSPWTRLMVVGCVSDPSWAKLSFPLEIGTGIWVPELQDVSPWAIGGLLMGLRNERQQKHPNAFQVSDDACS